MDMELTQDLTKKITDALASVDCSVPQKIELNDSNFPDLKIFIGEQPTTLIKVIDIDKKIYLGK